MRCNIYVFVSSSAMLVTLLATRVFAQPAQHTSRQIDSLVKEKQSRTPAQQKIDSRLLHAIREKQGTNTGKAASRIPALVRADSSGRIEVDINATITDSLLNYIKTLGGRIIFASAKFHSIRAIVHLLTVEKIAAYPEVKSISPAAALQLERAGKPGTDLRSGAYPSPNNNFSQPK